MKNKILNNFGIPVSVSLNTILESENINPKISHSKKRIFTIGALAVIIAIGSSFVAKLLIYLIDFFTNLAFYGRFSIESVSPANNTLGVYVILIPAIGGLIVGFMALYGSKAIRGHGIPEAMEQILTNQSKIKPSLIYLKPLSVAISIGTGGPFGAEGPIIATGGAMGSVFGQLLKITNNERKILLAAGATAGMSAIFGSPIAAIFLAIELLLFEFSHRSFIPVALACITGAAGHYFLFNAEPVFAIKTLIETPSHSALFSYSIMGIVIGLLSVLITKTLYFIEDSFEKLPVHWVWWPSIGGLVVGVIGYFAPRTLGVGYNNITDLLSGNVPMQLALSLGMMKLISWSISLGTGTSGGTLAPLLTIGGASGAVLGGFIIYLFPHSGVTISLAALVCMSAMFAGASRAFLTSIVFALETTGQSNALLPLLATCTSSYLISFFLMKNSIMTEKIARRGVVTPHSYESDPLENVIVEQIIKENAIVINENENINAVRERFNLIKENILEYIIISNNEGEYKGAISLKDLFSNFEITGISMKSFIKQTTPYIFLTDNLRSAIDIMCRENTEVLAVINIEDKSIIGVVSYRDIIASYKNNSENHKKRHRHISLKKYGIKLFDTSKKIYKN